MACAPERFAGNPTAAAASAAALSWCAAAAADAAADAAGPTATRLQARRMQIYTTSPRMKNMECMHMHRNTNSSSEHTGRVAFLRHYHTMSRRGGYPSVHMAFLLSDSAHS